VCVCKGGARGGNGFASFYVFVLLDYETFLTMWYFVFCFSFFFAVAQNDRIQVTYKRKWGEQIRLSWYGDFNMLTVVKVNTCNSVLDECNDDDFASLYM